MPTLKTERHHWWPRCVSDFWANEQGCVHWLLPDGEVRASRPKNFGMIGNGHHILLGRAGEATLWDTSFEAEFQRADDSFPTVIRWLNGLDRTAYAPGTKLRRRFTPTEADDTQLAMLVEGLISLAVRSPMNREAAVSVAERLRGPLPERERNSLIASNMRSTHSDAVKQIGIRGKLVGIFSRRREFIFGDGFYHNIRSPISSPIFPTILAPLTPNLAVLFARPMSYTTAPRFFTLVLNGGEVRELNRAVQVYSRDKLFYRSEQPKIDDAYRQGKHLIYSGPTNPIDELVHHIPGVPPRDTSLDPLLRRRG